jgi:endonuclease/exonuclease/phosphatase family metal-dependent hydrolase
MSKRTAAPSSFDLKKILPAVVLVIVFIILMWNRERWFSASTTNPNNSTSTAGPGEYLFCFWNVENFFDDQDDKRGRVDEEYDNWFARKPEDFHLKVTHLADILLQMNDNRGPDIIAIVEVETVRAAEALRAELNKRLPTGAAPYGEVAMKEVSGGRHIAPALITRLPVTGTPQLHGKGLRILETHVTAANHDLEILVTHWTSQLTDKTGAGRDHYANEAYNEFQRKFQQDPGVDFLLCGDFNTEPGDESVVKNLHAGGDAQAVRNARQEPELLDLFTGKDPAKFGTIYYKKPLIYDQICVSAGLLDDKGWTCLTDSANTWTQGLIRSGATHRQPWRFGNERDSGGRGYSDHFPVTVKLRVN